MLFLQGVDFFNTHLMKLCLMWLKDPGAVVVIGARIQIFQHSLSIIFPFLVYAVRKAAVENLKRLVAVFGQDWATVC